MAVPGEDETGSTYSNKLSHQQLCYVKLGPYLNLAPAIQ